MENNKYSKIILIHKYRKPLVIILGSQIVAFLLMAGIVPYEVFGMEFRPYQLINMIAIGGALLGVGIFMSMYLDTTVKKVRNEENITDNENINYSREFIKQNNILKNKINKLEQKIFEYSSAKNTSELKIEEKDKEAIKTALREKILAETSEDILTNIKNGIENILSIETEQRLSESFLSIKNRLLNELESLTKRAKINLIIGSITALSGVAIFITFVLEKKTTGTDATTYLLSEFAPRISLVLVIEVFAYFFLGLYKSNLSEIKYFQNEITNVEAKHIALLESNALGEKETITSCLLSLAETERNFLLKKGESTVSLEDRKISSDENSKALDLFSQMISKNNKP
ncbi:MAG: hypothetical protein OEW89_05465 [Gammaproteobacteria bacterium]|nr:hypothetical protein [Gammaproteobacteria bacterium]